MEKQENIFKMLKKFGLDISEKSGGCFYPSKSQVFLSTPFEKVLVIDGQRDITFYEPSLFLESVKTTEKVLNVKLFV